MNGKELREMIERLDETQVGLARFLGYDDSTIRRWIYDEYRVPIHVEMLLRVMVKCKLTTDKVAALVRK